MMREVKFLKENIDHWKEFERLLRQKESADADKLADLYIRLTDDLAWAQTFYPGSNTTAYLNELTAQVHQTIYKNKKEDTGRILRYWKTELPLLFRRHQKKLLTSFLVFVVAILIGIISTVNDPMFTRTILGDRYVNMTLHNIQNGDPLAVYKMDQAMDMFLGITFNNIRVSFLAFLAGLLASMGTGLILMQNGIMIGTFFTLFFNHNLLSASLAVVFIHGTLELSAIVIAGAAGFVMGNSILFPGSHSRLDSFKKGTREGLKMVTGLVPLFILAGFLESFVTRHTNMPPWISLMIICSSLAFVIWYFLYYPIYLYNQTSYRHESTF